MAAHAPVRRARPAVRALLAVVTTVAALVFTAAPGSASDTGDLIGRINSSRSGGGVARLATHGELMARAQEWAERMAREGRISHSNVGSRVRTSWEKIAENVGVASSTAEVHQLFMNSSTHRRNIMDPAFQYVGVGAAWRDGRVYVAEIFMRVSGGGAAASPAPAPTARAPRATTRTSRAQTTRRVAPVTAPPPKPEVPVRISLSLDGLRGIELD